MTFNKKRFYQILPGATTWTVLLLAFTLSFIRPLWMVYFIIIFDLYWLLRVTYFAPFLVVSWWRYRQAIKRDWESEARLLPNYEKIRHVIFLPTYKEPLSVVRETLHTLSKVSYPADRLFIVVAGEGRDEANFRSIIQDVESEFKGVFG